MSSTIPAPSITWVVPDGAGPPRPSITRPLRAIRMLVGASYSHGMRVLVMGSGGVGGQYGGAFQRAGQAASSGCSARDLPHGA
jgi:hypothetical protein